MSNVNMIASNQWASRPADERFWNLNDMADVLGGRKSRSREAVVRFPELRAVDADGELMLAGPSGIPARLTNWSFGQLVRRVAPGATPEYFAGLPAELAARNLNHGIQSRAAAVEEAPAKRTRRRTVRPGALAVPADGAQVLIETKQTGNLIRAFTTDYARLWNADVAKGLSLAADRTGWMTPPARPNGNDSRARPATAEDIIPGQESFGLAVKVGDLIAPAGCYAGDRDMFVFLVDPRRVYDDGVKGLMRGLIVGNSEVGASSFWGMGFYLENVCGNHIIHGMSEIFTFRMVHRGDGNGLREAMGKVVGALASKDEKDFGLTVRAARLAILGKDRESVIEWATTKAIGLTQKAANGAFDFAEKFEHTAKAPPTSAWGFVHGLTRYSQTVGGFADKRAELDRIGGRILEVKTIAS